jgi:hypothetical protein
MDDLSNQWPLEKLPIGIQAFETMRGQRYLYVDKTRWVHRMVTQGMFYFLARPRRFGKSLLVSTLKCLFEGRKELFQGLPTQSSRLISTASRPRRRKH